ncbi:MAG: DUF3592 domain-containing protein [Acidobacteria bacterium]|nr:DUF3592 domain-containing protein [Acidobacteriota bacterium]
MNNLVLIAMGIGLAITGMAMAAATSRRKRWGSVFGWVISSQTHSEYQPVEEIELFLVTVHLAYEYTINGVVYTWNTEKRFSQPTAGYLEFTDRERSQVFDRLFYMPGDRLVVRFDPANPADSMLEAEMDTWGMLSDWWKGISSRIRL